MGGFFNAIGSVLSPQVPQMPALPPPAPVGRSKAAAEEKERKRRLAAAVKSRSGFGRGRPLIGDGDLPADIAGRPELQEKKLKSLLGS